MSTNPSAQLRHELRTPLNHIVGYAELLLEELQGGSEPDLAAGLAALRADARQLLTVLNEVLARGQAGPSDLAGARDTLRPPLERVRSASTALHRRAAEKAAAALLPDLDRIGSAVKRLDQLLRHGGVAPAHEDGLAAAHTPSSAGESGARHAVVLVVDDVEENRDMLARRLRRQGYEVLTADGGGAALGVLAGATVDLVLLDVMMPDLDGYAVLQCLKSDPARRAIGFEGRLDYGAIGTVTNLAARLCGEAAGGQILVSARVAAAVEDLIDAEDVGPLALKGLARPVPIWSVRGLTSPDRPAPPTP